MNKNIYGRKDAFMELDKWTSAARLANKAIFGVNGVGKSTLLSEYFTDERLRNLAQGKNITIEKGEVTLDVPRIIVKIKLADWKSVGDLPTFLCNTVATDAFAVIGDKLAAEKRVKELLAKKDKAILLNSYLRLFKEKNYYFAFVFDDLNVISEDDSIGLKQYEYLRDLHDNGLADYLVTSDSDFTDSNVTLDFSTSFFCTKFTDRITLKALSYEGMREFLDNDMYGYHFSDAVAKVMYNVTSGFPGLLEAGKEIVKEMEDEEEEITEESFLQAMLRSKAADCYLKSWYKHLSFEWKKILYQIATEGKLYKKQHADKTEEIKTLGDKNGIGVVHIGKEEDTRAIYWEINCKLFQTYILNQGEPVEEKAELAEMKATCKNDAENTSDVLDGLKNLGVPEHITELVKDGKTPIIFNITNHNNIDNSVDNRVDNSVDNSTGKLIDNRSVNVISAGETVAALEDLSRLFSRNGVMPLESEAKSKIGVLEQFLFAEPESENEIIYTDDDDIDITKNARTTEFTQGLCNSQQFAREELTSEQKQSFWIPQGSDSWFDNISDSCRNQIICGINVYELLGNCITQFGLKMQDREHPRGILFALAFENHLKDVVGPAFQVLPVLQDKVVKEGNSYIPFREATISKTTIGTYTKILEQRRVQDTLANVCVNVLNEPKYNRDFWKDYYRVANEIREYRNCCCHSGDSFTTDNLKALISCMFEKQGLEYTLLFGKLKAHYEN